MAEQSRLTRALERFESALQAFEAAAAQAGDAAKKRGALEEERRMLLEDRSRLAAELDDVKAHAKRLNEANAQVATRVGVAMDNIKTILGNA